MIFEQLFDKDSSTFTYLLADENSREAVIIDPVLEHLDEYLTRLDKLNLKLAIALDTHVHADHVTALGQLRSKTGAVTYLGNPGEVDCSDMPLQDGQVVSFGQYRIKVIYTPGHTDDSYCFMLETDEQTLLFTGDTLLIGGTGRTDFQNGSASELYNSLHNKLLTLDDQVIVYPGHDYHGKTSSTIGCEKASNERIKISNREEFIEFMANLKLPNPKQMDIAVPANKSCGKLSSAP